eukprot:CAMPEP_0181122528 /NCGR_PEP_ID=MMETSP1071-20121207/25365_1 /TAXON_ID=35127 /ORGANISM="Thalassiosira sp., Strain NH16" /LENGTH=145 /DNA_ID=CAMNT_0023207511 /DNA_START=58 /DNA_END=495 /DNA_ORIENTATION=-
MKTTPFVPSILLLLSIGIADRILVTPTAALSLTVRHHSPAAAAAAVAPTSYSRKRIVLRTINNDDSEVEQSSDSSSGTNNSWANAAYSGLSNAWGYSRSVVNDRQRRRYERRRIRHRLKLEGMAKGNRPPTWAEKLVVGTEEEIM